MDLLRSTYGVSFPMILEFERHIVSKVDKSQSVPYFEFKFMDFVSRKESTASAITKPFYKLRCSAGKRHHYRL